MRVLTAPASERNSIWSVIVPADGTRAAALEKRRLRYVAAFVGQLSDKPLLASVLLHGVSERKAQWQIEKLRAGPPPHPSRLPSDRVLSERGNKSEP